MKASERVLLPNGQFAQFPERLEERAIATGAKQAPAKGNPEEPSLPRKDLAKKELEGKAKAKEAADKKKAKEEAAAKKLAKETKAEEKVENEVSDEADSMPSEVHKG